MAKRKEILKTIRKHAKANGLELTITEGGNHTKIRLGTEHYSVLPRHNEIHDLTAREIYKQLGMNR